MNTLPHFLFFVALLFFVSCSKQEPTSPVLTDNTITTAPSMSAVLPLSVSSNARYLISQDGQPFFMSGDAAYSLIVQVSTEDADAYLKSRSLNGFNTVIVNLIEHLFSSHPPSNFYNQPPFTGTNFITPNELYFQHVDEVLNIAAQYGIVVMLLPGYTGYDNGSQGWSSEMQNSTDADMLWWGQYVGNRYKNFPNIIWCIGGDADPTLIKSRLQSMLDGIRQNDPNHLVTAHNEPESYGITPWVGQLNINNVYTYGTSLHSNSKTAYNYAPTMPYILMEANYENEHNSTQQQLRAQAYWTLLSGGTGEMFGNFPIWSFGNGWKDQLESAGTTSMKFLAALANSRHWYNFVPDFTAEVATAGLGSGTTFATAVSTSDSSSILVYLPTSRAITVTNVSLTGTVVGWWYNPSTGVNTQIDNVVKETASYTPPSAGDWVLVFDAVSFGFLPPAVIPPLPVEMSWFTCTVVNSEVVLSWQTLTEKNNYGFLVQRRRDGENYADVSTIIAGAGTTVAPHMYGYKDSAAPKNVSLSYRLKQIDLDGTTSFTSPVVVKITLP